MPIGVAIAVLFHHRVDPLLVGVDESVEFVAHLLTLPLTVTGHGVLWRPTVINEQFKHRSEPNSNTNTPVF